MDFEILVSGVAALLGSAGFLKMIDYGWKIYQSKKKEKTGMSDALIATAEVYDKLREFCNFCLADRVVILQCNDSKAVPAPGAEIKSSAVFEYNSSQSESAIKSSWKNRVVDYSYIMVLREILERKIVIVETSELERGMLRNAYESYGVVGSCIAFITETPGTIWYLSVAFSDQDTMLIVNTPQFSHKLHSLTADLKDYLDGES